MTEFIKKFLSNQEGATLVYTAILLPIFLGFIALGFDIASWHIEKQNSQTQADAAALAAAFKHGSLDSPGAGVDPTVVSAANEAAILNGFNSGAGETITLNRPPQSGATTGEADGFEVIVRTPLPLFLSALITESQSFASSRAVALSNSGGDFCVLTLNETEPAALDMSGTMDLTADCGIAVKFEDNRGFKISGSATLDVTQICVEGGTQVGGNVEFVNAIPNTCGTPDDPLENLAAPAEDGDTCTCDEIDFKISDNGGIYYLSPGVYCNGIDISGNDNDIEFDPGEYILAGKGFKAAGANNFIHGDGVIFYNTDNCGDEAFGDVDFSGNNTVNFSAPTGGLYAGVLFFNDRSQESTDAGKKFKKAGTVDSFLDGIIYYPNAEVQFSGDVNSANSCGVKIISEFLTFNGTSNIFAINGDDCASNAIKIGGQVALVE